METLNSTKLGLMFNIRTPWNKDKPKNCLWIRASDIIGIQSWESTDYTYQKPVQSYGIRVSFLCGKGINGTDSTIQVTKETFDAVAEYLGIPVPLD